MKVQEAEQMMNDVRCQFRSAEVKLDLTYSRPDGNGYRVAIRWAGRSAMISKNQEWSSLRLAWQVLNENESR
jgi:hypothetical protein